MKIIFAAAAAAALFAAPALAQDKHTDHHAAAVAEAPMDMSNMTPEEMHKHCSMMMGGRMQGTPKHDHSADKGSAPAMKAPTEAEMKAMHEKCATVMAKAKPQS